MKHAFAADLVLAFHFLFALFAVMGGFLVLFDTRLMIPHLVAVVWSSIVNLAHWTCPLTPLENQLRKRSEQTPFQGSWIQHYLDPLLRPLGMPRHMELIAGFSVVIWNVVVYGIVFWFGNEVLPCCNL